MFMRTCIVTAVLASFIANDGLCRKVYYWRTKFGEKVFHLSPFGTFARMLLYELQKPSSSSRPLIGRITGVFTTEEVNNRLFYRDVVFYKYSYSENITAPGKFMVSKCIGDEFWMDPNSMPHTKKKIRCGKPTTYPHPPIGPKQMIFYDLWLWLDGIVYYLVKGTDGVMTNVLHWDYDRKSTKSRTKWEVLYHMVNLTKAEVSKKKFDIRKITRANCAIYFSIDGITGDLKLEKGPKCHKAEPLIK